MKVSDIMSPIVNSIDARAMIACAARRIADDDIGAFPALSEGKLAGIVTDRDIALRCVAERTPASASQQRSPIFASRTGSTARRRSAPDSDLAKEE